MATIRAGKQADGTTRYTAIIRIRKGKRVVHQECKTVAFHTAAASWRAWQGDAVQEDGRSVAA